MEPDLQNTSLVSFDNTNHRWSTVKKENNDWLSIVKKNNCWWYSVKKKKYSLAAIFLEVSGTFQIFDQIVAVFSRHHSCISTN